MPEGTEENLKENNGKDYDYENEEMMKETESMPEGDFGTRISSKTEQ